MELIKVEDFIVTEILSVPDDHPVTEGYQLVDLAGGIYQGDDIRRFDENWDMRPLVDLIADGLITLSVSDGSDGLPPGTVLEKVQGESVLPKTHFDLVQEGVLELMTNQYVDEENQTIVDSTIEEMAELGKIDAAQHLTAVRDAKILSLKEQASIAVSALTADYPDFAKLTWADQEREAKLVIENPLTDPVELPVLSVLSASRGIPLDELAQRVLYRANEYRTAAASIEGLRQHKVDLVWAAYEAGDITSLKAIE
jgi:hypothetical protein